MALTINEWTTHETILGFGKELTKDVKHTKDVGLGDDNSLKQHAHNGLADHVVLCIRKGGQDERGEPKGVGVGVAELVRNGSDDVVASCGE